MIEYAGRTAVVTGGSAGIGLALMQALAQRGMNVVVLGRDAERAEAAAALARSAGVHATAHACDVSDREAVFDVAARIRAESGEIELLVLNAGVTTAGPLVDHAPADWDWVLGTVFDGVTNGLQAFLPGLVEQGRGQVLITASMAGLAPDYFQLHGPYVAGKAGVIGLAAALRSELAGSGVGVSCLIPAGIDTALPDSHVGRPTVTSGVRTAESSPHPMQTVLPDATAPALLRDFEFLTTEYTARRTLLGLENDEDFIVTHPEFKPVLEDYFGRILAAFDRSRELEESLDRDAASIAG